jgi:hypothetical protein
MRPDQYVNLLLENIAGLSGEGVATDDGNRIVDEIEAYAPIRYSAIGETGKSNYAERREILLHTLDYLRDAYHDRVPRHVFEQKCRERGLSALDIMEAEHQYARWLV